MWEKWSRTWNNRKSDSLALCAHIKADGDIFVTANTHDFQRNLQKLRIWFPNLCILEPEEALREVQAMSKK
ncbi:MAG: hypothetical protein OJF49_001876 [Ktedonobacterales bacterium]|nr:MAG: hypothetical protein OJF49_001876 [Ktedonobacterales bacterium]